MTRLLIILAITLLLSGCFEEEINDVSYYKKNEGSSTFHVDLV